MRKFNLALNIVRFVVSRTPGQRGARVLFLTSIYAKLKSIHTTTSVDVEALEQMNDRCGLVGDTSTLVLPCLLADTLWGDIPELSNPVNWLAGIWEHIPEWLRYDSKEAMSDDLQLLMQ